ncbi:serine hydrolase domain-containing protein [Lusitaniella coriacea]|uniref:serine hydrolase domain-containing protein n=1 Tax=Lusitaniella coriacea TaxID=1983105 RepID=UPI003CE924C5
MNRQNWLQSKLFALLLFSIVVPLGGCSEAQEATSSQQTVVAASQLQDVLDMGVEEGEMPGATMAISTPQGNWIGASGLSNREKKTPMQPNDRFAIASISKTFVAVVVLQLVEEGELDLEESIDTYLPEEVSEEIPYSDRVTVRQLLNHTSGVAEYSEMFDEDIQEGNLPESWTAKDAIAYIYDEEPERKPGKKHSYCNSNYILLQLIVEEITERTLAAEIRDRILEPAGLKNTFMAVQEPIPGGFVTGYADFDGDGEWDSNSVPVGGGGLGDGGLISTVADLIQFARSLLIEKTLLSPEMMEEMLTFIDDREGGEYGLGVQRYETDFGEELGHTGGDFGFQSQLFYLPAEEIIIAVLVNDDNEEGEIDIEELKNEGLIAILEDSE